MSASRAVGGTDELVEERARAAAELRHVDLAADRAVRVADGVGAALGDTREQRLRGQRPIDVDSGLRLNPAMPHMNRYVASVRID